MDHRAEQRRIERATEIQRDNELKKKQLTQKSSRETYGSDFIPTTYVERSAETGYIVT